MSNLGIPVKITLHTRMEQEGNIENMELILFGKFYEKGSTSYLIYDEIKEEGTVRTIVKYQKETLQIIRKGAVNMRLAFQREGKSGGSLQTNVGTFLLQTVTDSLKFHWDQKIKQGIIKINYQFFMEQMEVGYYQLSFTFKEAQLP
ncbi:DUF1934 domain-containing protein [Fervidibacillus halotolerans]|uniref:DUF1934 domain-containing protein n=1 Tax=Fervidibacillus halotolerans TaxID=2980027 RepID=A0A9E8RYH2_9BACI|nr:DUF1934 domain-containing protein [Fervidibacillus halotolerans]WAA12209.1 DUF1934 domain-containing protein [Fervidibacillus halotolerans]